MELWTIILANRTVSIRQLIHMHQARELRPLHDFPDPACHNSTRRGRVLHGLASGARPGRFIVRAQTR